MQADVCIHRERTPSFLSSSSGRSISGNPGFTEMLRLFSLLTVLSRPIGTLMLVVIALTFYKGLFGKK